MRILCLHGTGTNARILGSQSKRLRAKLPSDWVFDFLDGELDALPHPDIKAIFPGPFLCYYNNPLEEEVKAAHELILEIVQDEGVFDMVLGFSQGAALAAGVIAYHQQRFLTGDLFKVAVFIGATMPFELGSEKARLHFDDTGSLRIDILDKAGNVIPEEDGWRWVTDGSTATDLNTFASSKLNSLGATSPKSIEILLRYDPEKHQQMIQIPTVHVVGTRDAYAQQGLDLASLCETRLCQVIKHEGGHEFPKSDAVLQRVADCIQDAAAQMAYLQ